MELFESKYFLELRRNFSFLERYFSNDSSTFVDDITCVNGQFQLNIENDYWGWIDSVTDGSAEVCEVSAWKGLHDFKPELLRLSDELVDYVSTLGEFKTSISDLVNFDSMVIKCRVKSINVFIIATLKNDVLSVQSYGDDLISPYTTYAIFPIDTLINVSKDNIQIIDSEKIFEPLHFLLKLLLCIKEGISVDIKNELSTRKVKSNGGSSKKSKSKKELKEVTKYISLSKSGKKNLSKLKSLIRSNKEANYIKQSWWVVAHERKLRNGEVLNLEAGWRFRNPEILQEESETPIVDILYDV